MSQRTMIQPDSQRGILTKRLLILFQKTLSLQSSINFKSYLPSNVIETYKAMSAMDDVYATELLQQSLIDARERAERLEMDLEAARAEMQESQRREMLCKAKYRELDDSLEAEEAKTNNERVAREKAEETVRRHQVEVLKARRSEAVANEHCEAAETEIISLQMDLSTERSALAAAGLLSTGLQEDLRQAEINEMTAYDLLDVAKAKTRELEQDATNRIQVLELQAQRFEEAFQSEHQRLAEAEHALGAVIAELETSEFKLSDVVGDYEALEAKCDTTKSVAVPSCDTERNDIGEQAPNDVDADEKRRQAVEIDRNVEEPIFGETSLRAVRDQTIVPTGVVASGIPALPEPAVLRPAQASATASQMDIFNACGRALPAPRVNPNRLRWRFLWKLPSKSLRVLFQRGR